MECKDRQRRKILQRLVRNIIIRKNWFNACGIGKNESLFELDVDGIVQNDSEIFTKTFFSLENADSPKSSYEATNLLSHFKLVSVCKIY